MPKSIMQVNAADTKQSPRKSPKNSQIRLDQSVNNSREISRSSVMSTRQSVMSNAARNQGKRSFQIGPAGANSKFGNSRSPMRQGAVSVPPLPLTKTIYGRGRAARDQPKTFFKGATALLASEKHHVMGN